MRIKKMMKKVIIALMAILASNGVKAQQIDVYCNDNPKPEVSFLNTETKKYKVVFREEEGTYNGHKYVEIGGLKWATMNIGATTVAESMETAIGDYYAWGELDTYYSKRTGIRFEWDKTSELTHIKGKKTGYDGKNYFDEPVYKVEWSSVPYDKNYRIKPEYDVAKATWGGKWRMPTREDINMLLEACGCKCGDPVKNATTTITEGGVYIVKSGLTVDGEQYKVAGALFVSSGDPTQRMFLPSAGSLQDNTVYGATGIFSADIWLGEVIDPAEDGGYSFPMSGYDFGISNKVIFSPMAAYREWGFQIRPVAN